MQRNEPKQLLDKIVTATANDVPLENKKNTAKSMLDPALGKCSLEQLFYIFHRLKNNDEFKFLREEGNLLRKLTGKYGKTNTWQYIINQIQYHAEKCLVALSKQRNVSDYQWKVGEAIAREHVSRVSIFENNALDNFLTLKKQYDYMMAVTDNSAPKKITL